MTDSELKLKEVKAKHTRRGVGNGKEKKKLSVVWNGEIVVWNA